MVLIGLSAPTSVCVGLGACALMSKVWRRGRVGRRDGAAVARGVLSTVALCVVLELLCKAGCDFAAWALVTPLVFLILFSLGLSIQELVAATR